jgi:2'-5' RNA ligase
MPPRCFVALALPDSVVGILESARRAVTEGAPAWAGEKWVPPCNLHVTVSFLGAVDDRELDARVAAMRAAAASVPSFDLPLAGVVAVPSPRRATMLWATLEDDAGSLAILAEAIRAAFPETGADPGRPLRPHVTMARARSHRRIGRDVLASASSIVFSAGKEPEGIVSVRSARLFSSTLRPGAPSYREIADAPLSR